MSKRVSFAQSLRAQFFSHNKANRREKLHFLAFNYFNAVKASPNPVNT